MNRTIERAVNIVEKELDSLGWVSDRTPIVRGVTSIYEKSDETDPEMLAAAYLDYGDNPPKDYNIWRKSYNHWFGMTEQNDPIWAIEESYNDVLWNGELKV